MINYSRSNIRLSRNMPVLSSEIGQILEGHALRNAVDDKGNGYAARSDNETTQTFIGISGGPLRATPRIVKTAAVTPTAGNLTIKLPGLVLGADISVMDKDQNRLTVEAGAGAVASGEVGYTTTTNDKGSSVTALTFNVAQAGTTYYALFSVVATAADVMGSWPGNPVVSGSPAEDLYGTMAVLESGTFCVDTFAAGEDWNQAIATSPQIKMTTGGLFVPGNSATAGTAVPASLVKAPTPQDPWLILSLR